MRSRYLLHQAVAHAAEQAPEHEAVRCGAESLSYQALFERSNRLARMLRAQGVRRGDRVGIYLNKGLDSTVAIYGILAAGAAYVPLDPLAPVARVGFVIQDCGIRHVVSAEAKRDPLSQIIAASSPLECVLGLGPGELAARAVPWEAVNALPGDPLDLAIVEQDLAYILYTSGSTGTPKGIMHTHRSGLSFAEWAAQTYGLTASDRLSNHAPLHFDLSTFDYFAGALAGATTVIVPEAVTKLPPSLSRLMAQERLSVWYSVPFALIQLLQRGNLAARDLGALRWVLFAGEPFPTKHLRELMAQLPQARFSNLYGPTETNVCTYYHVPALEPENDEPVPIGRPCANIEALVVDGDDRPMLPGEVGELLIRGGVVMRGYWGQPDKTARGFYRRPALEYLEDTFYRTGDLVQQLPDGNLRYLGRKDRQVKTRGYRVELDEIEVALLAHVAVEEAAVFAVPDGMGSNQIEAAVVPKPQPGVSTAQLFEHLAQRLPAYAIPARLVITADLPRT
ncbi:MAG: amino acid adenylation domain-containing protein, partial [Anaerolineales bacterium]|nr:amino acid adenylation domain-containing protein [Anaerolineales bacterium]